MTIMTAAMRAAARARQIKKNRPHQVALPDWFCTRENFHAIEDFCRNRFSERPTTRYVEARWEHGGFEMMRLYCFTSADHADIFATHFDGERFDHKLERDGPKRLFWARPGAWSHRIWHGPLTVPRSVREQP